MSVVIDRPGVYDLPAEVYHSDPVPGGSLSASGAKRLLPPSCPALFRHWVDAGQEHKRVFDIGHAAHAEALGIGAELAVIDAENYTTKAARSKRDAAYADGMTPVLRAEHEQVQAMAAVLREHPVARELLRPATGEPEQSLFWIDSEAGVWRRAMLDWLPDPGPGRLVVPDYKTTTCAEPGHIARAVGQYGYHQQAAWYLDGIEALGLAPPGQAAFVFVFQEKTPPHLVTVAQLDPATVQWGRLLNRKALDVYRTCLATGRWPGYGDAVLSVSLPAWAQRQLEAAWERGDLDPTHDLEATA